MTSLNKNKNLILVSFIIILSVLLFTTCINNEATEKSSITNPNGEQYAGSGACRNCHKDIYDGYINTAHYSTSDSASKKNIKGSFDANKNTFSFNDHIKLPAEVKVVMEERDSGLFQVAYINGIEKKTGRFDITIGSGRKAQTYLYWRGNQLLQLPISYFTATGSWANSPGYPYDQIKFNRLVPSHCLECHSTIFTVLSVDKSQSSSWRDAFVFFDHNKTIYGIGCERCHGPAAKHVEFQSKHPEEKKGRYIINPGLLARQQNLDACALCHSGIRDNLKPVFSFITGDTLSNYFSPGPAIDTTNSEVHGNQYGLLIASKCFKMSQTMNCSSCHNPHIKEKEDPALFSQRCMTCHSVQHNNFCKIAPPVGTSITNNCIDCHMPIKASKLVNLLASGKPTPTPLQVRSHLITIYPEESRKILASMKAAQKISP